MILSKSSKNLSNLRFNAIKIFDFVVLIFWELEITNHRFVNSQMNLREMQAFSKIQRIWIDIKINL